MELIGKYEVVKKLGEGATSDVFLCNDPFNRREVAIKVVSGQRLQQGGDEKIASKLFLTEASLAGKLNHPHIIQIYDAVVSEDRSYLVMEYVPGGTLERFCQKEHLLSLEKAMEIIFKCTRALQFAQQFGVIHRDIKPANILLTADGDIKITDFGSAMLSSTEQTQVAGIGSPAYMSPQQIKEHPLNHQTDIYSLGVVMYQLLTGVLPFQASNNYSMMYQIANTEPVPPAALRPDLPARLDQVVRNAMHKELEGRYPSWEAFSMDLASAFHSGKRSNQKNGLGESEKFSTLRALNFFRDFSDVELWEVIRMSHWEEVPDNHRVMHEGDLGDFFCILASGDAKVMKKNRLLDVLVAGDCFGEMAYLSSAEKVRTADVRTMKPSRLVRIGNVDLDQASDSCRHRFDRAFLRLLVDRLARVNDRLIAS
jgi:serine/threonine protein kinase